MRLACQRGVGGERAKKQNKVSPCGSHGHADSLRSRCGCALDSSVCRTHRHDCVLIWIVRVRYKKRLQEIYVFMLETRPLSVRASVHRGR